MLKVGGENVSAAEVEGLLATHPAVKIVQVVGAPRRALRRGAAAFVELGPGATVTEQELDRLLPRPDRHLQGAALRPLRRPSGRCPGTKIQKFRLREQIAEELRAAGITEAPRLRSAPATATATAQ